MGVSDAALLKRWAAQRDAEAFAELVRRHSSMVYGACLRVLRNPSDAEDAAQDCFLNLVRLAQEHGAVPASLGGWLHAVAVRRALDRRRSEVRRQVREEHTLAATPASAQPAYDDILEQVDAIIAELPEDLRHPLVSHFLEGKTHREIARELGLPRRTVTSRIARAVEDVRERLGRAGVTASAAVLASVLAAESAHAAPAALAASLGKIAVIGETGGAPVSLSTLAGVGGIIVGAKKLVVLVVAAVLLLAGWYARETTANSRASLKNAPAPTATVSSRPLPGTPATTAAALAPKSSEAGADSSLPTPDPSTDTPAVVAAAAGPAMPERPMDGEDAVEDPDAETGVVEGTVLIGDEPLANERMQLVYVDSAVPINVYTDAQGFYRFDRLRGGEAQVVTGFWDDTQQFRYVERRAIIEPGLTTRVDFAFPAAGSLEGRVLLDGAPPRQCRLHVELIQASGAVETYDAQGDAEGSYRFNAISEGTVTVKAEAANAGDYQRKRTLSAVIRSGQVTRVDFDIDSADGLPIVGSVTGLAESQEAVVLAMPGVVEVPTSMSLIRFRQISIASIGEARVGAPGGEFRIDGMEPGTYTVAAVAVTGVDVDEMGDWRVASGVVTVEEGVEARIDFDLTGEAPPPPTLTGTVTGIEGNERVALVALQGNVEIPSPLTEEAFTALANRPEGVAGVSDNGAFQMHRLDAGTYTLLAVAGNPGTGGIRATAVSVVEIVEGAPMELELTLEPMSQ